MLQHTDDLRIEKVKPLIPPAILMEELPVTESASNTVANARRDAEAILRGDDDRLVVVVGPCSIHDPQAAIEYGGLLKEKIGDLSEDLCLIMRVYLKARTTVGWKGLINDPNLDGSFDINNGLRAGRKLLLELTEMGLPAGSEFLDTISPQFIADLISWGAIGARTTESQIHRELSSGLSMPVGFKNGTDGTVQIAIDAIGAARHPHHFLSVTKQGISAIVATAGNDSCHVILRGGNSGPNYAEADVEAAAAQLEKAGLPHRVMVDCSHGNSSKDHAPAARGRRCCRAGFGGSDRIFGVMLESHLVEGRQDQKPDQALVYGQSITDACISWDTTVEVLEKLAEAVRAPCSRLMP